MSSESELSSNIDRLQNLADRCYVDLVQAGRSGEIAPSLLKALKVSVTRLAIEMGWDDDKLTGLPHRGHLRLQHWLRPGKDLALIYFDFDNFKDINDYYFHRCGDRLLAEVGERLQKFVRKDDKDDDRGDYVYRVGGDEFLVVAIGPGSSDGANKVAQRLYRILTAESYDLDGEYVWLDVSIGVRYLADPNGDLAEAVVHHANRAIVNGSDSGFEGEQLLSDWIHQAEQAMYAAKHDRSDDGFPRIQFYKDQLGAQNQVRNALKVRLKEAIASGQVLVKLQPIIDLASRRLYGFEAFLTVDGLEDSGQDDNELLNLIVRMERSKNIQPVWEGQMARVLEFICQAREQGFVDLVVSTNVTAEQVAGQGFRHKVMRLCDDFQIPSKHLAFEVVERQELSQSVSVYQNLSALKVGGFGVIMDDFGTGHNNASQLLLFLSYWSGIKFDRLFIDRLNGGSPVERALVEYYLGMSRVLSDFTVTAEGIESEEVAEKLLRLGVRLGQGYFFGQNLTIDQALDYLQDQPAASPS